MTGLLISESWSQIFRCHLITPRETSLGDKAAVAAKSSPKGKSWRETSLGDKAAAAAKSSPEGNHEGRQAWETRPQRQPRAAQKGNHEGRQAWETRWQRQPRAAQKGNHESLSSFLISLLGFSWLQLPPCLASFSPFLSCSCLQPPCVLSLSPFSLGCFAAAALFPELVFLLPAVSPGS